MVIAENEGDDVAVLEGGEDLWAGGGVEVGLAGEDDRGWGGAGGGGVCDEGVEVA